MVVITKELDSITMNKIHNKRVGQFNITMNKVHNRIATIATIAIIKRKLTKN